MADIAPPRGNHIHMHPALASLPATALGNGRRDNDKLPWEYSLRKYLLLLATLVATVTYTAGFTPPGGVWQDTDLTDGGHLAGDPILRYTSKLRYVVFFYSNATAFASSLVVIVLILILSVRHELASANLGPLGVLRGFMVLDLLSLMVAYTAGIYRDVPVYTMILAVLTVVYVVVFHVVQPRRPPVDYESVDGGKSLRKQREKPRKVLMLLATFAVSVTYLAGLSAPGGFWNDADDGHRPGDPVLMGGRHEARLKAFVHLNSTAFFWSLLIAVQLLDKHLRMRTDSLRFVLLYTSIVLALLGLIGAYATGSSRDKDTTIYVTLLGGAVPACIVLLRVILLLYRRKKGQGDTTSRGPAEKPQTDDRKNVDTSHGQEEDSTPRPPRQTNNSDDGEAVGKARSLVLLLATLAATITYQAGLDPPGGLWDNDGVSLKSGMDYKAGDPILRTTNPKRYNAFFYCNSVAFVASLLAIILVKKNLLLRTHALEAAMILDLFGLIGAYAAGSCREVSTSIYAMALAGAVLVYVVIHVVFFTLDHQTSGGDPEAERKALEVVEKRRKRLMLFAILAATITYQAGLTPPGGFFLKNDKYGHLAGDPVLLGNSPHRYKAFFYCNSVSFMLSIAMIILLVNPNLYKPAIQSHAISVCTAAGMLSLVGAYAAGSTQHMSTSIKIFGLAAAILIVVVAVVLLFVILSPKGGDVEKNTVTTDTTTDDEAEEKKQHSERKYLMLLGILAASVTYQAGLKPPGGVWEEDDQHGHVAGNPVMHDNGKTRYQAFFYINSTSFVASIIVIILLLLKPLHSRAKLLSPSTMNTTIVLDLLGLLVAYAVGSARSWKATGYVFALVFMVLAYIAIHVNLAHLIKFRSCFKREAKVATVSGSD